MEHTPSSEETDTKRKRGLWAMIEMVESENAALRKRVKELEAQLSREQESVNELSIALQDAEKRVKELEELRRATTENE